MKEKILAAAVQEMEVHYANFRMDDLARRLNISKRTLYEYFSSKNEIVETILLQKMNAIREAHQSVLQREDLSIEEKLEGFFSVESRVFHILDGKHMRVIFNKMPYLLERIQELSRADWDELQDYLEQSQHQGRLESISIPTLIMMLRGVVNEILYDQSRYLDDIHQALQDAV